jgi:hypothetical protein
VRDSKRDAVQRRLELLGFNVKSIDEHESECRPDLLAIADQRKLYVEVKTRTGDRNLRAQMESVLAGQTAAALTALDKHNSISADIEYARNQLASLAMQDDFRLLWFQADNGLFVHNALEQIGATLYGIRMIIEGEPGAERPCACIYAGHADFYRFPEIDGVIVEVDQLITLLINPFSARRQDFAQSHIARVLGDSVFDVNKAEAKGILCIAAANAPRRDDNALLDHLRGRYPDRTFHRFIKAFAGTVVATIDGRESRAV